MPFYIRRDVRVVYSCKYPPWKHIAFVKNSAWIDIVKVYGGDQ